MWLLRDFFEKNVNRKNIFDFIGVKWSSSVGSLFHFFSLSVFKVSKKWKGQIIGLWTDDVNENMEYSWTLSDDNGDDGDRDGPRLRHTQGI